MWFKNIKLFRIDKIAEIYPDHLNEDLFNLNFVPCLPSQDSSVGFVPINQGDYKYVYELNNQYLIKLRAERKLLPSAVINQATKERALVIAEQQGFKPGRNQTREIKEQVIMELLPKAFTVSNDTYAWIDPVNKWLAIDSSSNSKADLVIGALAKALKPFPFLPLHVNIAPSEAMTRWLTQDEPPECFTIDQNTELTAPDSNGATISYVRQSIDSDDAKKHILDNGKKCTKLALTWRDKISFTLDDNLAIKKIRPLDVLKQDNDAETDAELFASDFALMTGEMNKLLTDLIKTFGGFKE